jgi:hypothetical protein
MIKLVLRRLRAITPRYRSEAEGQGLRGPFFIDLSVYLSISRSVPFYDIMIAPYQDMSHHK